MGPHHLVLAAVLWRGPDFDWSGMPKFVASDTSKWLTGVRFGTVEGPALGLQVT